MSGASKVTTDHEAIRAWIEQRGGTPARVKSTGSGEDPGLLRVDFPGYRGKESLEPIAWDDFFRKFEEKQLAFLYQDEMRSGEPSRFFKFVTREDAR